MPHRLVSLALVCGCAAGSNPIARSPAPAEAAWHVVLDQHEVDVGTPQARYVVYVALIPPDGSAYEQLRSFAVREPCQDRLETQFCTSIGADSAHDAEWGVSCGDTRLHVRLDRTRDQVTAGLSDAATSFCAITTAMKTFPARGAAKLTAIPWTLADGGMSPDLAVH